jgi:maltose O-acetyltransferase
MIQSPETIDGNLPWLISIGDDCIFGKDVLIYAHDASMTRHLGFVEIGKVTIGRRTYIGARTLILPGVTIGDDVIVGAGSVVTKDIPSNSVAVGNPARVIRPTSEFIEEHRKKMLGRSTHLHRKELSNEDKRAILNGLADGSYYYKS